MGKVYNKGIVSPKGFDMSGPEPADQREIVENKSDLYTLRHTYPGIEVKVRAESFAKYKLVAAPSDVATNWVLVNGAGGESSTFTGLIDSPDSYTGSAGKVPAVNAYEGGLEFIEVATEANNVLNEFTFENPIGLFINTPDNPVTSTNIILDSTKAVNGGVVQIYYKSTSLLTKDSFIVNEQDKVISFNSNQVADELCFIWIVYDKGNKVFHVNVQAGYTGATPPTGNQPPPTLTIDSATVIVINDAPPQLVIDSAEIINTAPSKLAITSVKKA